MRTPLLLTSFLFTGTALASNGGLIGGGPDVALNEIRISQPGPDADEYIELTGSGSLDGLSLVVIGDDGPANVGVIETVVGLTGNSITDGFFVIAEASFSLTVADLTTPMNLENENLTFLIVEGFSGSVAQDLDTNDDGTLDIVPWTNVVDCVGLQSQGPGDPVYCATIASFPGQPGYTALCASGWIGKANDGGGADTPGFENACVTNDTCDTPIAINEEGAYPWNNTLATTTGFDGGDPVNCMSPVNPSNTEFGEVFNDLFWVFTVPCDGDWTFDTDGSPVVNDTRLNIHSGNDCTATCLQSNDDIDTAGNLWLSTSTVFGALEGDEYLIQTGTWNVASPMGAGVLNVTREGGACASTFSIGCVQPTNHYQGSSVDLSSSGFMDAGLGTGLNLRATGGPTPGVFDSWGIFLVSDGGTLNQTVNNGLLCLEAPAARYNLTTGMTQGLPQFNSAGMFDANGDLVNMSGTSNSGFGFDVPNELPFFPVGQVITPGDTYYFQLWYRDMEGSPADSSSFSNMLIVNFP